MTYLFHLSFRFAILMTGSQEPNFLHWKYKAYCSFVLIPTQMVWIIFNSRLLGGKHVFCFSVSLYTKVILGIWLLFWNLIVLWSKRMSIPVKNHYRACERGFQSHYPCCPLHTLLCVLLSLCCPQIALLGDDKKESRDVLKGAQNKGAWSLMKA